VKHSFPVLFLAAVLASQAATPHRSLPAIGSLDGLGVNIHFTEPKPGELEMIAAAGFRWIRMDFAWGATERKLGEYDFAAYDRLVAALEKNGLRAVFILDYGNPLYDSGLSPHTDEGRAAFAKWTAAAVKRYAGKGYLWEMWNEPNIAQFWKPKPDVQQYIDLTRRVAAELRAARLLPAEAFIGPATSTIDLNFLEACFKAGLLEDWSAVSVHPYRQKPPETVDEEYRSVRLLIHRYAPKDKSIPVLSGEWGYSAAWPSMGKDESAREEAQAKYLARMFLTNIANDVPLSIWYDWRDDGDDPREGEHRFGIVRRPYREAEKEVFEAKPAYRAMQTLTRQLSGMTLNKVCIQPPGGFPESRLILFKKGEELRLVFTKHPDLLGEEHAISRYEFEDYQGVDALGRSISRSKLGTGESPPYYVTPDAVTDHLRILAAPPRFPLEIIWRWPVRNLAQNVQPDPRSVFALKNPLERPIGVSRPNTSTSRLIHRLAPGEMLALNSSAVPVSPIGSPSWKWTNRSPKPFGLWTDLLVSLGPDNEFSFEQSVSLYCENPVGITPLPPGKDFLLFRIDNPSEESVKGQAIAKPILQEDRPQSAYKASFQIAKGERDSVVRILSADLGNEGGFNVDVQNDGDEKNGEAFHIGDNWFAYSRIALETFLNSKLRPDGDAAVVGNGEIDQNEPPGGLCASQTESARVKYRFEKGWKFLQFTGPSPEIPLSIQGSESPEAFALWIYGDGKGCQARIRFKDASGQTFQSDGPKIDYAGWHVAKFPMQPSQDHRLSHWGGANDGIIHYPITWESIFLLDNISREPIEGEIYISAPTLIY
jgi:hypothetical protein